MYLTIWFQVRKKGKGGKILCHAEKNINQDCLQLKNPNLKKVGVE